MATVLLRKTLISKEPSGEGDAAKKDTARFWHKLSQPTHETIKTELLVAVEKEPQSSVRKKLADTISELSLYLSAYSQTEETHIQQQWPQLLPFLFQISKSESEEHRKSSLDIFSKLCLYIGESLRAFFPVLKQVLHSGLNDQSLKVIPLPLLMAQFAQNMTRFGIKSLVIRIKLESPNDDEFKNLGNAFCTTNFLLLNKRKYCNLGEAGSFGRNYKLCPAARG